MIPGQARAKFNIRFNDHHTQELLRALIEARIAKAAGNRIRTRIAWEPSNADVFVTRPGPFTDLVVAAIEEVTGRKPDLNTGGGTSDARFIKNYCPVIEFGLVGQTMHQIDERTPVADLEKLTTNLSRRAGSLFRMTGKILVLTAIDDELDKARAPDGVEVIYTGVGKINAASAATLALLVLRPALVINYGTAGKINETLHGLVEVSERDPARHDGDAAGAARTHAVFAGARSPVVRPGRRVLRHRRQFCHHIRSLAHREQDRHRRHGAVRDRAGLPAPRPAVARVQVHHR